jgi:hypothetical protein
MQEKATPEKVKLDSALHRTTPNVKKALLREQNARQWPTWEEFKEYLITTYASLKFYDIHQGSVCRDQVLLKFLPR